MSVESEQQRSEDRRTDKKNYRTDQRWKKTGALGKLPFVWRMVARSTELPVERITRGVGRHRHRSMVYRARVKVSWSYSRAVFDIVFKEADKKCYIYIRTVRQIHRVGIHHIVTHPYETHPMIPIP